MPTNAWPTQLRPANTSFHPADEFFCKIDVFRNLGCRSGAYWRIMPLPRVSRGHQAIGVEVEKECRIFVYKHDFGDEKSDAVDICLKGIHAYLVRRLPSER